MEQLIVSPLEAADASVEVVERKGLGHPDTICDALAETLSRNLCREYRRRFDTILHHNTDKALLCGGRAAPAFGGGEVLEPIAIYLAGRAITEVGGDRIPVRDIAVEGSREWLRANLHALDAERQVTLHCLVRPGSADLQTLFSRRGRSGVPLANDTSIGVAHAPPSALERLVLALEKQVNGPDRCVATPAWGEDVKIMGIRQGDRVRLTIACAMVGRHLGDVDAYVAARDALARLARDVAARHALPECEIAVNAADDIAAGQVYLTVTGTSAEGGDDGQVGRGNRVGGLITPCHPMSLEAAAGKNPVSHVGKIYNVVAQHIADAVVAELEPVAHASCVMASRIGAPVTSPAIVSVKLAMRDGRPADGMRRPVEAIAARCIDRIPALVDDFVSGKVELF